MPPFINILVENILVSLINKELHCLFCSTFMATLFTQINSWLCNILSSQTSCLWYKSQKKYSLPCMYEAQRIQASIPGLNTCSHFSLCPHGNNNEQLYQVINFASEMRGPWTSCQLNSTTRNPHIQTFNLFVDSNQKSAPKNQGPTPTSYGSLGSCPFAV